MIDRPTKSFMLRGGKSIATRYQSDLRPELWVAFFRLTNGNP